MLYMPPYKNRFKEESVRLSRPDPPVPQLPAGHTRDDH